MPKSVVLPSPSTAVKTKLVITDVDGTLSSFWDYFVPAMRDFLREMATQLSIPVDELAEDIGHVIDRRCTHEYPWLLEETGFAWKHFVGRESEFIERVVMPFWQSLDRNREKYLRPFPEVMDTLQELKDRGVYVVALSDAPAYMARVRNQQLFDGVLDAVYCLNTPEPDSDEVFKPIELSHGHERVHKFLEYTQEIKTAFYVLDQSCEKPCPTGLDRVLREFDVYPQEALFIGDSLAKDGMVALSRGIRFVWAHYGHHVPAEYEELVNYSLKPRKEEVISKPFPVHLVSSVAARYSDILELV